MKKFFLFILRTQLFSIEFLIYHYIDKKYKFRKSKSITRNKIVQVPKRVKTFRIKNTKIRAINALKYLPKILKYILNEYNLYSVNTIQIIKIFFPYLFIEII